MSLSSITTLAAVFGPSPGAREIVFASPNATADASFAGDGFDLRNGAQMTSTGKAEWLDRQRELDSVTNNYNMDINVAQISDLQDLLNIADSAQLLERMG